MKFKYFLRGFGIGIIFTSVVCLVAFMNADSDIPSDKKVIERAKELGMIEKEDSIEDLFSTEKNSTNEIQSEQENKITESTESESSTVEENTTENITETSTTNKENQKDTSSEASTSETENATEEQESTTEQTKKTVTITIQGGMSSFPVCQKLQELGVIEDATDFDSYLIEHGYAHRISVGTHTLTIGMSYEEIAIIISDPM